MAVIIVPYTRYEFRAPAEISKETFDRARSATAKGWESTLRHEERDSIQEYLAKCLWIHKATLVTFGIVIASMCYGILLLSLYGFGFSIGSHVEIVWPWLAGATIIGLFLLIVVLRSHIESYSSFRQFLKHRRQFFSAQKKHMDAAKDYEAFRKNFRA